MVGQKKFNMLFYITKSIKSRVYTSNLTMNTKRPVKCLTIGDYQ